MLVIRRFRIRDLVIPVALLSMVPSAQAAITADQARIAIESFNNVYWRSSNKTFYKYDNRTGELDYWMWAHAWETEMDAYERTKDPAYLQKIRDTYDGFVAKHGTDLKSNDYNDDIAWWVIAAVRAYDLTGVTAYRDLAKKNFDWVYTNQVDDVAGGGVWWKNNEHKQKNSASTTPFAIAGFKLARQLSDPAYLDKAKKLHNWVKTKLWRTTGEVGDRIEISGSTQTTVWGPLSYNHGTFIASAWEYFKATGDSAGFRDAIATTDYFKNVKCDKTTGIFPDERGDGTGNTDNDAGMYKTVFVHYAMRFIMEAHQWQYLPWLNANAESLWKYRRLSDNLMYFAWATPAPTQAGKIGSQMATGGVALLNLLVIAEGMQSFYMEGTDTTNAQGQGLWNEFTVTSTGLSANDNLLALYPAKPATAPSAFRPFPHSFADIQKAPTEFGPFFVAFQPTTDFLNRPFVIRMTDTTYAKVVLLKKLPDNRYYYRYGVSRVHGNTVLAEIDYGRSPRYKAANLQVLPASTAPAQAGLTVSEFKWEAPLANSNTLTGYEVYIIDVAKADSTKAADLATWTRIATPTEPRFTWSRVGDNVDKYVNLVVVYSNGKSAPLEGWMSITNEKQPSTALDPKQALEAAARRPGALPRYALPRNGRAGVGLTGSSYVDPTGRDLVPQANR